MNLRTLANSSAMLVSPNVSITLRRFAGYAIGQGARQMPAYAPGVVAMAQLQAMSVAGLEHIAGLNLQGESREIYLDTQLGVASRPEQSGGDIIEINGQTWLVTKVIESWPGWSRAIITRQVG